MGWFIDFLKKLFGGGDTKVTNSPGPTNININVKTGHNNQNTTMGDRRSSWYSDGGKAKPTPRMPSHKPTQSTGTPSKNQHEIERLGEIKLYGRGLNGKIYSHSLFKSKITAIGIKTTLKNTTKKQQKFTLRFCLFTKEGKAVAKVEREFTFGSGECRDRFLEISGKSFNELRQGTYGYEFWIDSAKLLDRSKCTFKLK